MSTAPPPESRTCPTCGETNYHPRARRCWLCHEPLAGANLSQPTFAREPAVETRAGSGLVVWWVLLAVVVLLCVGLATEAPGVAVVLAVLATPVMVRGLVTVLRRRGRGQATTGGQLVGALLVSLGVVIMMGVSAVVAFYATCFAVCLGLEAVASSGSKGGGGGDWLAIFALGGGAVVGLLAAFGTYRLLRHRLLPPAD